MSDHAERISAEEELAARRTASALGELNEEEQANLKAELAQRTSSGESLSANAGSSGSADVEQLANALRKTDRSETLPEPSARLRELLESRLVAEQTIVELKKLSWLRDTRRRVWITLATGLSLLVLAIPVRHFLMTGQSRESNPEIAQLQAVNDRLRAETKRADDRLALEQAERRYATALSESREKELKLLVTPRIIVTEEQKQLGVSVTREQPGGATNGASQPQMYGSLPPNATPYYITPERSRSASGTGIAGREMKGVQGVPSPSQLAAGPTGRTLGNPVVEEGAIMRGTDGAGMYGGGMEMYGGGMYGAMEADNFVVGESVYGGGYGTDSNREMAHGYAPGFRLEEEQLAQSRQSRGRRLIIPAGSAANEQYSQIIENRFASVSDEPLSTFSIDVDTASYANARRFLTQNQMPPANAIRIEEFINYFSYDYPAAQEGKPFSVNMEVAECPWQPAHQLVRIGLKGKEVPQQQRPASNIVFLLDVSGSMQNANKLPLLKQAMKLLTDQLTENDRVSIVTYAGNAGMALDATNGESKQTIRDAIDALNANGSTNGSAGIQLAYEKATQSFIKNGANRVILATDGDLNVGVTDDDALVDLIKAKAASGVFLTVLGFGEGNLKDGKLEKLADNGNGMYAYIDSLREARKVLVEQISGSLVTIAKDVKIKVEFNPAEVVAYRLLGYENRLMSAPDFDNDAKDAGEIGAGHTVTALYEIVPTKIPDQLAAATSSLKYQRPATPAEPPKELTAAAETGELLTLFLRYKQPDADESTLAEFTVENKRRAFDDASTDFRFAAAVASFAMVLRNSEFRGNSSLSDVEQIAGSAIGSDAQGHRTEFLDLVRKSSTLQPQRR